jgi:hypothetical protein
MQVEWAEHFGIIIERLPDSFGHGLPVSRRLAAMVQSAFDVGSGFTRFKNYSIDSSNPDSITTKQWNFHPFPKSFVLLTCGRADFFYPST